MSQENVDRCVQTVEAFNRRDIPGVLRFVDPNIQFEHRLAALQGTYAGRDRVRDFLADLLEHFDRLAG
jgi:hypothetical protein